MNKNKVVENDPNTTATYPEFKFRQVKLEYRRDFVRVENLSMAMHRFELTISGAISIKLATYLSLANLILPTH